MRKFVVLGMQEVALPRPLPWEAPLLEPVLAMAPDSPKRDVEDWVEPRRILADVSK